MQIDVMPVGEHELYQPQRIAPGRRLFEIEGEIGRGVGRPVDRLARDHATSTVDQLQMPRPAAAGGDHAGQVFVDRDRARHIPARVDHHVLHHVGEFRRAGIAAVLPDDRTGLEGDAASVHHPGSEIGEVHPDVALRAVDREPALTLHRHDDRLEPLAGGHVDRPDRRIPGHTIGVQPGVFLEELHRTLDLGVIGDRGRAVEIAHRHQTVAQLHHGKAAFARTQRAGLHRLAPTAIREQPLQLEFLVHQPGIFVGSRHQRMHEGLGAFGRHEGIEQLGAVAPVRIAGHPRINIARSQNPGLDLVGIGQEQVGQRHLDPATLARAGDVAHHRSQITGVVGGHRQPVVFRREDRFQQRLKPGTLFGARPGPDRLVAVRAIERAHFIGAKRGLGNRLRKGGELQIGVCRPGGRGQPQQGGNGDGIDKGLAKARQRHVIRSRFPGYPT